MHSISWILQIAYERKQSPFLFKVQLSCISPQITGFKIFHGLHNSKCFFNEAATKQVGAEFNINESDFPNNC